MPRNDNKSETSRVLNRHADCADVPDVNSEASSGESTLDGPVGLIKKVLTTGVPLNVEFEGKQYYFDGRWYDSQYRVLSKGISKMLCREIQKHFPRIADSYARSLASGATSRRLDQDLEAKALLREPPRGDIRTVEPNKDIQYEVEKKGPNWYRY